MLALQEHCPVEGERNAEAKQGRAAHEDDVQARTSVLCLARPGQMAGADIVGDADDDDDYQAGMSSCPTT